MLPLIRDLMERHNINAAMLVICKRYYVRLSAHIYNTIEDFRVLGEAVLSLKDEV